MTSEPCLEIEELRKNFGDTVAVDGLSLEVHPGEIVGMIGPDGAGKTTTMRIACGLIVPDRGHARILGFDSTGESQRVKDHLGYMPQRFSLYPDLTVAENLRFFADLYLVPGEVRIAQEQRLMEFSRLAPFRKRRAGALSGGMKQKLALSCTLIHTPEVLILDEPTTGVDPVSRKEFWDILRSLADDGMALLLSTPYMDEAQLCDRILLVHRGKVVARGTAEEVCGLFGRRLLEVRTAETGRLLKELKTKLPAGVEINRFGDSLHIVYSTDRQRGELVRLLEGFPGEVRDLEPGIEDVFIELIGAEQRETA